MKHRLPSLLLLFLLSALTMGIWSSCSKYDSDSVGSKFFPSNSLVRNYTHAVYVEFTQNDARVWGRYVNEVDFSVDGNHITLENKSDSLALIVYGYPATTDCSLTIDSKRDYALYISKLIMRSQERTPIYSTGGSTCYMVIPKNSKNEIYTTGASAVIEHQGRLGLSGEGELLLTNNAPATKHPVVLEAKGGLHCQYAIKLQMACPEGDAIRVSNGPMRSSLGTWTLDAGQNAISNRSDSIVLIAGSYKGTAREGKFFDNAIGTVIRQAIVEGISGNASDLLDTLQLYQHYDSTLVTLQEHFVSISVAADSALVIAKKESGSAVATFTPRYDINNPWVVISNNSLLPSDTLIVLQN